MHHHQQIWADRMAALETIPHKQDMRDISKQHSPWLVQAEKTIGVLHRINKPPPGHEHEIHTEYGTICSPKDMIDQN
eukprot:258625-Pyramimonas_sp.AAC.1